MPPRGEPALPLPIVRAEAEHQRSRTPLGRMLVVSLWLCPCRCEVVEARPSLVEHRSWSNILSQSGYGHTHCVALRGLCATSSGARRCAQGGARQRTTFYKKRRRCHRGAQPVCGAGGPRRQRRGRTWSEEAQVHDEHVASGRRRRSVARDTHTYTHNLKKTKLGGRTGRRQDKVNDDGSD